MNKNTCKKYGLSEVNNFLIDKWRDKLLKTDNKIAFIQTNPIFKEFAENYPDHPFSQLIVKVLELNSANVKTTNVNVIKVITNINVKKCNSKPQNSKQICSQNNNNEIIELQVPELQVGGDDDPPVCSICFESDKLLGCKNSENKHFFHDTCIIGWINFIIENKNYNNKPSESPNFKCPLCKQDLELSLCQNNKQQNSVQRLTNCNKMINEYNLKSFLSLDTPERIKEQTNSPDLIGIWKYIFFMTNVQININDNDNMTINIIVYNENNSPKLAYNYYTNFVNNKYTCPNFQALYDKVYDKIINQHSDIKNIADQNDIGSENQSGIHVITTKLLNNTFKARKSNPSNFMSITTVNETTKLVITLQNYITFEITIETGLFNVKDGYNLLKITMKKPI